MKLKTLTPKRIMAILNFESDKSFHKSRINFSASHIWSNSTNYQQKALGLCSTDDSQWRWKGFVDTSSSALDLISILLPILIVIPFAHFDKKQKNLLCGRRIVLRLGFAGGILCLFIFSSTAPSLFNYIFTVVKATGEAWS